MTESFGIDVGGSGARAAVVDVDTGQFLTERHKVSTPQPLPPEELAGEIAGLVRSHGWEGPVGCGFPSVVRDGVTSIAINIHKDWIDTNARELLRRHIGHEVYTLNDADAAGLAEMRLGEGRGQHGVVITLTFGSGIGSAIFVAGRLLPNSELGGLEWHGGRAEAVAAARVRQQLELTWEEWTDRVNGYLTHVEDLFSPDLIIVSGGISKQADEFFPLLEAEARLVPAHFRDDAGIVGAAVAAHEEFSA